MGYPDALTASSDPPRPPEGPPRWRRRWRGSRVGPGSAQPGWSDCCNSKPYAAKVALQDRPFTRESKMSPNIVEFRWRPKADQSASLLAGVTAATSSARISLGCWCRSAALTWSTTRGARPPAATTQTHVDLADARPSAATAVRDHGRAGDFGLARVAVACPPRNRSRGSRRVQSSVAASRTALLAPPLPSTRPSKSPPKSPFHSPRRVAVGGIPDGRHRTPLATGSVGRDKPASQLPSPPGQTGMEHRR
jgi:hypothetical protein